jgi:ribosome-binding factor A
VEKRGQKYHRERLGEALREEIETIVEGELADPRIGLVNVSSVELADDSRSARVLVMVEGDDAGEADRTLEGLAAAVGFIRHEVAERLHLRRAPELYFQLDRSEKMQARVDQLLSRARKRSK